MAQLVLIGELGFDRDEIVNENFRLSARRISRFSRPSGYQARGVTRVRAAFQERFFELCDQLCDANKARLEFRSSRDPSDAHVDLYAHDAGRGICGFFEAKSYPNHEGLGGHQKLLLAVTSFLTQHEDLKDRVVQRHIRRVLCEVVVFYPEGDPRPANEPDEHRWALDTSALAI